MGRPAEGIRASVSAEATVGEGVRAERQHRANRRDERAAQGRPYEDAGGVGGFERRVGLAQPIVTGHVGQPGAEGDAEEKRSCAQHEDDERERPEGRDPSEQAEDGDRPEGERAPDITSDGEGAPLDTVGDEAGDEGQRQEWDVARRCHHPRGEGGMRLEQDQPGQRETCHLVPEERRGLAAPDRAEDTVSPQGRMSYGSVHAG